MKMVAYKTDRAIADRMIKDGERYEPQKTKRTKTKNKSIM